MKNKQQTPSVTFCLLFYMPSEQPNQAQFFLCVDR